MKWRILTEGEERVKRQGVVMDLEEGHVDNANNRTSRNGGQSSPFEADAGEPLTYERDHG